MVRHGALVRSEHPPIRLAVASAAVGATRGVHERALLLLSALAMYSQNETFAAVTPTVDFVSRGTQISLVLALVAFSFSLVRHCTRLADGNDPKGRSFNLPRNGGSVKQHGHMIPYRVVMVAFTALFLVLTACGVDWLIQAPFSTLSFSAACFHVWLRMEDNKLGWTVILHFLAHASSAVFSLVYGLRVGYPVVAFAQLFCIFLGYLGVYKFLSRFRASVRLHGSDSAAKCSAASFSAFWGGVVPSGLYFGSDTLGALFSM